MPLSSGTRFGPYEIVSPLGAGGMGEVYRAHDSRLGRDVAIKVLLQAVAGDADRLARFEREARVLASLNHSNIAHLHGLEQADGTTALVMELVEGETLAERLARGAIPLDDALPIARQIAEALEAAHEQGIIHRDLKPANVKVRPDGTVKVLDFGLAKVVDPPVTSADAMNSPTLSAHATQQGVILGTAAYMSPEQAAGKPADRRTDLWAFGVVLMEMLTARRVFDGESVSHVIASVLRSEPEWTTLPSATPASIRRLLRQCLAKDPRQRLDSAAAARLELDGHTEADDRDRRRPTPRQAITWAAIAASVVLGAGWLLLTLRGPSRSAGPIRLTVELGASASMPAEVAPNVALSPDGSTLAFVALTREARSTQLYVRRLDQMNAAALPGTEDARNPFFSPDGRWVGFFDRSHAKLKKVPVAGGGPVTLADIPDWRGGDWSDENGIVFQARSGARIALSRITPDGGPPQPFASLPDLLGSARWPQVLPRGRGVLYTVGLAGQFEAGSVVVQALPDGKPRVVLRDAYYGRFVNTGHILFMHRGTLFAAPFNLERLEVTGPSVRIVEGVSGSNGTGAGEFAVSPTGVLMYVPGPSSGDVVSWMDRSGAVSPLRATSGIWTNPSFSPSGDRLAMEVTDGTQFSVWVYDLARGTETRLTSDDTEFSRPVWAPDGRFLAFSLRRGGALNLYWARADGADKPQRLVSSDNDQEPFSWHPSGALLAFVERTPGRRVMVLPISGDEASGPKAGEPRVFLDTQAIANDPTFSPDGRWLAYVSNETSRSEVYVRPFPGPGPKVSISAGGGRSPQWSPATHELLYRGTDNRIMTVAYRAVGDSFVPEKPDLWSPRALPAGIMRPLQSFPFAVHPDGRRVALFVPPEPAPGQRDKVVIIFNFFTELRQLGQRSTR